MLHKPGGTKDSESEQLIEYAGRLCWDTTEKTGTNPERIQEWIKLGHESVIEHASATFYIRASRVFTHELVRHRAGTSISQESLRYVRLDDVGMWVPSCFAGDGLASQQIFEEHWKDSELAYQRLLACAVARENVKFAKTAATPYKNFQDMPQSLKKLYSSAARRVLPIGLATKIGWGCNMRALRHVVSMRTHPSAEEEIRIVFAKVATIANERWPNVMKDFMIKEVDGIEHWYTENEKV